MAYCNAPQEGSDYADFCPDIKPCSRHDTHDDNWYPASGGTEEPFVTRNRFRLLYCWQPSTGKHAYLNLDTDLILTDEEARLAMGL